MEEDKVYAIYDAFTAMIHSDPTYNGSMDHIRVKFLDCPENLSDCNDYHYSQTASESSVLITPNEGETVNLRNSKGVLAELDHLRKTYPKYKNDLTILKSFYKWIINNAEDHHSRIVLSEYYIKDLYARPIDTDTLNKLKKELMVQLEQLSKEVSEPTVLQLGLAHLVAKFFPLVFPDILEWMLDKTGGFENLSIKRNHVVKYFNEFPGYPQWNQTEWYCNNLTVFDLLAAQRPIAAMKAIPVLKEKGFDFNGNLLPYYVATMGNTFIKKNRKFLLGLSEKLGPEDGTWRPFNDVLSKKLTKAIGGRKDVARELFIPFLLHGMNPYLTFNQKKEFTKPQARKLVLTGLTIVDYSLNRIRNSISENKIMEELIKNCFKKKFLTENKKNDLNIRYLNICQKIITVLNNHSVKLGADRDSKSLADSRSKNTRNTRSFLNETIHKWNEFAKETNVKARDIDIKDAISENSPYCDMDIPAIL